MKGNKLSFVYDDDEGFDGGDEPFTIEYMVQGERLTLLDQDRTTFIRVRDSVIAPYL